jgi:cytochrome c oxidase subunit 2
MKAENLVMQRLRGAGTRVGLALAAAMMSAPAWAAPNIIGQPVDGAIGLQPGHSPQKLQAIWFHDTIILPVLIIVSLFVLGLLLWCIIRYNSKANPVPAKFSHNTAVEIAWTGIPVLILMVIAIFSFKLLFFYHAMPKPDLTVKATGYQWYWGYAYPDQKIEEYTSNYLKEDAAKAKGEPYLLAVDNPLVVPVNKTVRVLVTGNDVIHDFGVPAFGLKTDAMPGRTNETWFKADKAGIYYGQCDQLCGVNHAYMPIEIVVMEQADFDAWVASKAPKTAAAPAATTPAAAPAATPAPAATTKKVALNTLAAPAVVQH